jgi:hypothetical protein
VVALTLPAFEAATAVFVWSIGPLSPGLLIRIRITMFCGCPCVVVAAAVAA